MRSFSRSSCEAELKAASDASAEIIWLRRLLKGIGLKQELPTTLWIDNMSAIRLIKNPEQHQRTKHVEVQYFFIREHVNLKRIEVKHIKTQEQLADPFTKSLSPVLFQRLRMDLNIINWSENK